MWLIPVLFSGADQDGELVTVDRALLRTHCHAVRHAEAATQTADGQGMSARHVETLHPRGIEKLGQDVALGPSCHPKFRSRGPSPSHGR